MLIVPMPYVVGTQLPVYLLQNESWAFVALWQGTHTGTVVETNGGASFPCRN